MWLKTSSPSHIRFFYLSISGFYLSISGFTFPFQVFSSQFELVLIVFLAAHVFPTAKPIIHQPKEVEGGR